MRRKSLVSFLFLLCSSPLWADDATDSKWRVSVLASEISTSNANQPWDEGSNAGVGVGLAYVPNAQWDVEFLASSKSYVTPYTRLILYGGTQTIPGLAVPVTEFRRYRVLPLEISATRHFLTAQPIAPFLRAGVRYVAAPDNPYYDAPYPNSPFPNDPTLIVPYIPVPNAFDSDRTSAQVGAGVRIRMTPRTAIRAEVDRLIRDDESEFDPLTRFAVGLSWVF